MYQSRLHITNGVISLALDAESGEVLEFVREKTGDNILKNHIQEAGPILDGMLSMPGGDVRFTLPRHKEFRKDASLKPVITLRQGDGEAEAELYYPRVMVKEEPAALSARVYICLEKDSCRSVWQLKLCNETGYEACDIAFPALDGIWLGESYADNVLVYPHFAGCRMDNPTRQLASSPKLIRWKWQNYLYTYNLGQAVGERDERGAYVRRLNYTGDASMLWLDLHDPGENAGLYLACRNESHVMKGLRMESFGEENPGTGLAVIHRPALGAGEWESGQCILALHEGDWHWAADAYRAWFETLPKARFRPLRPQWFNQSPALMAHYDFQYQEGGIVHTFRDIPELMRQAMDMGISHLLLAGWHEDGFDYGFPHYTPNHLLGGADALKAAIRTVRNMGGHVSFYINSRLCNTAFEDEHALIARSAIMQKNGRLWIEKYGADEIEFASMCISEPGWRARLVDTVDYLVHEIGADSIYLDQFAMATSIKCYHPGHTEHAGNPCAWNQGYEHLLEEIREKVPEEELAVLYEGCNDIYGASVGGQLISELHCPWEARMPEVYKYTFPDQMLVDMMNPRRHSAMRPEHVARHSTQLLHRAFVMDAYFWCYDLEYDNNWRGDPEQFRRLKQLVRLRREWLSRYGHGRFRDTQGLEDLPAHALVKRFELEDGFLIVCASEHPESFSIQADWQRTGEVWAEILTASEPEPRAWVVSAVDRIRIQVPAEEAVIIAVHCGKQTV